MKKSYPLQLDTLLKKPFLIESITKAFVHQNLSLLCVRRQAAVGFFVDDLVCAIVERPKLKDVWYQ
jgi:hypothetical protein